MNKENSKLKLLYLREILLERTGQDNPISMREIIKALEGYGCSAERKSVYTDINLLRESGLDIILSHNPTGYFIGSRDFELAELKILADAIMSSKFITKKKSKTLIEKLGMLTSSHERHELIHSLHSLHSDKATNELVFYTIDSICAAIKKDVRIDFQMKTILPTDEPPGYVQKLRRNGKRYIVEPVGLCWDDENYYLIAYEPESEALKHYRIDRIIDVRHGEVSQLPEKYRKLDIALYSKQMFDMYGGVEKTVTLEFDKELISVVVDRFGDIIIRKISDRVYSSTFKVFVSPTFFSWLFTFGEMMTVISPEDVRQEYCKRLTLSLKRLG